MANVNRWTSPTLLCLALAACSADSMKDGTALMYDALADARVENERHADACEAVPSMDEMMDELERHDLAMEEVMARMGDARAQMGRSGSMMGMGHCGGAAFGHMSETLDGVPAAMSEHEVRMKAAESLDEARSECSTHVDGMAEMMQSMTTDLDGMPCGR
jgi:hypothetical protein